MMRSAVSKIEPAQVVWWKREKGDRVKESMVERTFDLLSHAVDVGTAFVMERTHLIHVNIGKGRSWL